MFCTAIRSPSSLFLPHIKVQLVLCFCSDKNETNTFDLVTCLEAESVVINSFSVKRDVSLM